MKSLLFYLSLCIIIYACEEKKDAPEKVASEKIIAEPPAWIKQGNIYEVNVRQYTPEGTFNAFSKHASALSNS